MSTKKERRRQKAEERRRQLLKEKLEREIALGALNTRRYRTTWRRMMMRIKMPLIKQNVEVAWHTFERALDVKDYRISFLMDTLDAAEEQYRRNEMHHIETIDKLLGFYESRMRKESMAYQKSIEGALEEAEDDRKRIAEDEGKGQLAQEGILRNITRRVEESLTSCESAAISKIEAFIEDSKDARRLVAGQLQTQIENLWGELRTIFDDYQDRTRERRKTYESVAAKDTRDRHIIAQQLKQTASLFEGIRKLREKIAAHKEWSDKEIGEINDERDFFHNAYWIVKNRFLSEEKKDRVGLTVSTIEYNHTVRHLQNLVTKAERLLTLMQNCRKYQTQDEKIIPFVPPVSVQIEEDIRLTVLTKFPTIQSFPEGIMSKLEAENEYSQMQNFWRRLGSAQIITTELRLERDKLKVQADQLRDCLRCCLSANTDSTLEAECDESACKISAE